MPDVRRVFSCQHPIDGSSIGRSPCARRLPIVEPAQNTATGTFLDWNCGPLAAGLACYRRGEFFEAHEHWEAIWLTLREPEKSFLQAVIQVTAALHHLQQGRPAGTASLLRKALRRLDLCLAGFGGLALEPLRTDIRELLRRLPLDNETKIQPPRIQPGVSG